MSKNNKKYEILCREFGKMIDLILEPFRQLGEIFIEAMKPIIEFMLIYMKTDDCQIRMWLAQKQRYFGW